MDRDTDSTVPTPSETLGKRYQALSKLFRSMASRRPEDMARVLRDELRHVLNFDHLDVLIFKEGTSEIHWSFGTLTASGDQVLVRETAGWWIFEQQQMLSIDISTSERFPRLRDTLKALGSDAYWLMGVPLTSPHRRLGALLVASSEPRAYSEEELRFLSLVADGMAMAIDGSRSFDRSLQEQSDLEHQHSRLELLLDLTNRITSNLDLHELLRATAASIRELMKCDCVHVALPTEMGIGFKSLFKTFLPARGFSRNNYWSRRWELSSKLLTCASPSC